MEVSPIKGEQRQKRRRDSLQEENYKKIFDLTSKSIPLPAFLDGLPVTVHGAIHKATHENLWSKLGGSGAAAFQGNEPESVIAELNVQSSLLQCVKFWGAMPEVGSSKNALWLFDSTKEIQNSLQNEMAIDGSGVGVVGSPVASASPSSRATSGSTPSRPSAADSSGRRARPPQPSSSRSSTTSSRHREPPRALRESNSRPSSSKTKRSLLSTIISHKQRPIILLPTLVSDLLNMSNAYDFLQEGNFSNLPGAFGRAFSGAEDGENSVNRFQAVKQIGGKTIKFRFVEINKVKQLDSSEWIAVVAVILSGPEWQLIGWPFEGVTELFKYMKGFYFTYADNKVPPHIAQWNVEVMWVNRTLRHCDGPLQCEFWRTLEAFLQLPREGRLDKRCSLFSDQQR